MNAEQTQGVHTFFDKTPSRGKNKVARMLVAILSSSKYTTSQCEMFTYIVSLSFQTAILRKVFHSQNNQSVVWKMLLNY